MRTLFKRILQIQNLPQLPFSYFPSFPLLLLLIACPILLFKFPPPLCSSPLLFLSSHFLPSSYAQPQVKSFVSPATPVCLRTNKPSLQSSTWTQQLHPLVPHCEGSLMRSLMVYSPAILSLDWSTWQIGLQLCYWMQPIRLVHLDSCHRPHRSYIIIWEATINKCLPIYLY